MRETEAISYRDLVSLQQGRIPSRARRSSAITNDRRIGSLTRQLLANEIPLHSFLRGVSGTVYNIMRGAVNAPVNRDRPHSPERAAPPPIRRLLQTGASSQIVSGAFCLEPYLGLVFD